MIHIFKKIYTLSLIMFSAILFAIDIPTHATITITPYPNPYLEYIWHGPVNIPYTNNRLTVNYEVESPLRLYEWTCVSTSNGVGGGGGGWGWYPPQPTPPGPRNAKGKTKF